MASSSSGNDPRRPMNTAVDLEIIRKLASDDLVSLIRKFQGPKVMVFDRALAGPTNLIAPPKILESHGVCKILPLEKGELPQNLPDTILFICRPRVDLMPWVASCIQNEERRGRRKKYHLCFVPQKSLLCTKWLEGHRLLPSITSIEELPLLLFPLDTDVLSLELESTFKEFYVDNDPTSMYYVAKALVFLQRKYGIPNAVFGKGQAAKYVHDLMQSIQQETGAIKPQVIGAKIENIILIDRQVDLLSPLVTQLTYEGLIDEFYGINSNHVKLPGEKFSEVRPGDKKTIVLNSSEALYAEMRDKNFSAIGGILRAKTKEIQDILVQKDTAQSLPEMKRLVQQLPAVNTLKQSISNHTSVAELLKKNTEGEDFLTSLECEQELLNGMDTDRINSHIEDLCSKKVSFLKLLRLLIIQCVTSGGLKPKVLQHYERLIIQNYGFENVLTLRRLEQVGLLRGQTGSRAYSVLRRTFNLTVCDGSEINPEDFAYVHSIYAPLSIRLVQNRLKPALWNSVRESLQSLLPGPIVDEEADISLIQSSVAGVSDKNSPKTTLVVFIGGCTFAEISALRFLAQHEGDWEFLVVTTKLINGNSFLTNLFDTLTTARSFLGNA